MPRFRGALPAFLLSTAGFLVVAAPSPAQTYGLGDQVLSLGATSFVGFRPGLFIENDGYTSGYLYAPVSVPQGAEIFKMCIYARGSSSTSMVGAQLIAFPLMTSGTFSTQVDIPGTLVVATFSSAGYVVACTEPFSFTYLETRDVNGDFFNEHISLNVVEQTLDGGTFGGVRIFWRRQVSPPFGAPTFNDVPASDPAYQFIEALVLSGVTAGCGSGSYCPDAPLTRRQMAVFLAKALGLHWLGEPVP